MNLLLVYMSVMQALLVALALQLLAAKRRRVNKYKKAALYLVVSVAMGVLLLTILASAASMGERDFLGVPT